MIEVLSKHVFYKKKQTIDIHMIHGEGVWSRNKRGKQAKRCDDQEICEDDERLRRASDRMDSKYKPITSKFENRVITVIGSRSKAKGVVELE